jgi:hypothetical protein
MAKRNSKVDILKEIRRALRALRRAERSIVAAERADRRLGEKRKELAELQQLAEIARAPKAVA